ncbi:MAG: TraR/DksA C4-type zinc finger protein [Acidobacteriota bacterium]
MSKVVKFDCYRRLLERKWEEVRQRLSTTRAAEMVQRPEGPLDFGDWCQKSLQEWLFLNENRLEVALLREIRAALERLDGGVYGVCQQCGEPIDGKRLDALPWAAFCVPCQERLAAASARS